jgi:hypothetical protein
LRHPADVTVEAEFVVVADMIAERGPFLASIPSSQTCGFQLDRLLAWASG